MDNLDESVPMLHVHYLQYIFCTVVGQTHQKSKFCKRWNFGSEKLPEYVKSTVNIALWNFVNFCIKGEEKAIIAKFDLDIFVAITKEDQKSVTGQFDSFRKCLKLKILNF